MIILWLPYYVNMFVNLCNFLLSSVRDLQHLKMQKIIYSKTPCFMSQVSDILGKYPELMEGFNEFLGHCENIGVPIHPSNISHPTP